MTIEQLRDLYLKDIDEALDSWILMRRLSEEQKRRLRAQRSFLQNASTETLQELLSWYEREPARQEQVPVTLEQPTLLTFFSQWQRKGESAHQVYCFLDIVNGRAELGMVGYFHKRLIYIPMQEFTEQFYPYTPENVGPTTEPKTEGMKQ